MVAIGLLDIPLEIQLQIAEFVETGQALKALSLTSRSLRSIAQSVLFERLRINLASELRGSFDDLLANPRICASIHFFELRGRYQPSAKEEEKLSLIASLLPAMVGLRAVLIYNCNISVEFMGAFLRIAENMPLRIKLGWNTYAPGIWPMPNQPLRISHLHLASPVQHTSLNFYKSTLRACSTSLTELNVIVDGDELTLLADIDLPTLHSLTLIMRGGDCSRTSATAFISAQKTIRKLDLRGKIDPPPAVPLDALPNLRELNAPTALVNHLVPGRPVEAIEVSSSQSSDQDWFGAEVAQSTARVRKLRVHLNIAILDTRMVKRMVTILPSLESLWLSVFDDVSDLSLKYLGSFSSRHSSKSSKFSPPSSVSRAYTSVCPVAKSG